MSQADGETNSVLPIVSRMLELAPDADKDHAARASLLQLSRELTSALAAPDEVISLHAFSARPYRINPNYIMF